MLGFYEGFPETVHKAARFAVTVSNKKLQQAIIQTLQKLNSEKLNLEEVTEPLMPNCSVMFEFGIADGDTFSYLNQEEAMKALEKVRKITLQTLDFFCATRYYKEQSGRRTPLKFDYFLLRIVFYPNFMEAYVFHERGPMHVSPEDIINFIVSKINSAFPRKALKPV
ncbi:hypothetical protein KEJ45_01080 [Candidatus Bathyarchaeota archaeon]|nr:hypothetical protein [Candidatus Bathyarchaeota archaeon]